MLPGIDTVRDVSPPQQQQQLPQSLVLGLLGSGFLTFLIFSLVLLGGGVMGQASPEQCFKICNFSIVLFWKISYADFKITFLQLQLHKICCQIIILRT